MAVETASQSGSFDTGALSVSGLHVSAGLSSRPFPCLRHPSLRSGLLFTNPITSSTIWTPASLRSGGPSRNSERIPCGIGDHLQRNPQRMIVTLMCLVLVLSAKAPSNPAGACHTNRRPRGLRGPFWHESSPISDRTAASGKTMVPRNWVLLGAHQNPESNAIRINGILNGESLDRTLWRVGQLSALHSIW